MLRSKVEEETITGHHLSDTITAFADPNYGDGSWLHDDHGPIPVAFDGIAYDLGEEPPSSPVDGRLIPQDAPVIGYASAVFTGEGTKTVTIDVPESAHKPGFVSWVWKVRKDHQGQVRSVYPFRLVRPACLINGNQRHSVESSDLLCSPGQRNPWWNVSHR